MQGQSVGGGMEFQPKVAPRFGREGDQQLNGSTLVLGSRLRSLTDPHALSTPELRQTRRHDWRPQRQAFVGARRWRRS